MRLVNVLNFQRAGSTCLIVVWLAVPYTREVLIAFAGRNWAPTLVALMLFTSLAPNYRVAFWMFAIAHMLFPHLNSSRPNLLIHRVNLV